MSALFFFLYTMIPRLYEHFFMNSLTKEKGVAIIDLYPGGVYMAREEQKKEILIRLKRIEGQVRGLQRMIEREAACADVLTQVAAVTAAIKRVGRAVVQASMEECLEKSKKETGGQKRESLRDLRKAISQYMDWV